MKPALPVPKPDSFTSRLRGPEVTARIGLWLGVCFGVAFLTGLYSHFLQSPPGWITFPTRPVWIYRVTQGLHVIAGTAAVPLLLVKLWSVYPKLFERFDLRNVRRLTLQVAERGSIALLVSAAIFELATGLTNITHWYPWSFSFRATHYAVGWIAIGSLATHIAVKLPIIKAAITGPLEPPSPRVATSNTAEAEPAGSPLPTRTAATTSAPTAGLSRRGLLRTTWLATGVAVATTAGATVPWLRQVSVFGVRSGDGPQGVPVNKSAIAAGVIALATAPSYMLRIVKGSTVVSLSLDDLTHLPQTTAELPIACVEGWSASGRWRGPRIRELLDMVSAPDDADVLVRSLQPSGPFRNTTMQPEFARDPLTLLALELNGETLGIDHGFPCRVIAPARPGVLQTKWVAQLEVL